MIGGIINLYRELSSGYLIVTLFLIPYFKIGLAGKLEGFWILNHFINKISCKLNCSHKSQMLPVPFQSILF